MIEKFPDYDRFGDVGEHVAGAEKDVFPKYAEEQLGPRDARIGSVRTIWPRFRQRFIGRRVAGPASALDRREPLQPIGDASICQLRQPVWGERRARAVTTRSRESFAVVGWHVRGQARDTA